MTRLNFLLSAIMVIVATSCCSSTQTDSYNPFPAKWMFSTENIPLYESNWTGEDHYLGAMTGSPARITAVRSESKKDVPFTYRLKGNRPEISTLTENDYILFSTPVSQVEKGSHIEIDAVIMSYPNSPKYFIAEIFDNGEWKASEADLRTAEENPEIKYTFECSGTGSKRYQHNSIYQTFRLEKGICNSELKIRFRAVGDITCSGEPQSAEAENGWTALVGGGFTGAYIQNYGTDIPKDTTSVLCLGNSFTYYWNAPSMLKEITGSQGHYFDVFAHLKGGQTFGQHTALSLTHDAIKAQVYDYAILQDQSVAAANYVNDKARYAYVPEDFLKLSEMVLAHSPECKLILEHTWGYSKEDCKGFKTVENFNARLKEGCGIISALNGAAVSHIGDAFLAVDTKQLGNSLHASDNHHQSYYGTYLKSCVNYLMITGEPFNENAATCGIDAEKAKYLRETAERIVLGE